MKWRPKAYPVDIDQTLDAGRLATLSDAEAQEAEESGFLAGNQMYQDLRGFGWEGLGKVIEVERGVISRLQAAPNLEAEAAEFEDERLDAFEPSDGLWDLDVGVAAATIALSAIGATPVGSCNAGGFGGHHQARHPYVAFFLGAAVADSVVRLAQAANVGLRVDESGLAQIYGGGDLDLLRFAEVALESRSLFAADVDKTPST